MCVCVRSPDPFPKSSIKNLTQATVLVTVAATSTLSHQFKLKMQSNCTTVGPTQVQDGIQTDGLTKGRGRDTVLNRLLVLFIIHNDIREHCVAELVKLLEAPINKDVFMDMARKKHFR